MALTPGTMLGPYCIEETLGAGGMGEVYRARDTRLDRRVAVKVLAAHYASSEMMRQRFDAEARTVSSLNHPGICQLFDVGHEQNVDYIVMEFLEGITLAERIDAGPLQTKELVRMAVEVTDALDAAHRSGVIHRDLKPGNIMLTQNGAKLMDFGLAKLAREPELLAQTLAANDTRTQPSRLTNPGSAVGTIAYMSPEQARGDALDIRSDLFSLGALLYECATGRRAFPGKTSAVVFHAILAESPHPLEELAPETPRSLVDLIERLLEKDPDLRPQTAGEVRAWLKRVLRDIGEPSSHASGSSPAMRVSKGASPYRTFARTFAIVSGIVLLIIGGVETWRYLRPKAEPPMVTTLNNTPAYEQLTQLGNVLDGAAISPDGKYVAYMTMEGGRGTVWVRQIAANSAVQVVTDVPSDAGSVSFSADGQFIYFSRPNSPRDFMADVYVVPTLGGEARKVLTNVSSPVGVSKTGRLAYVRFDADGRWALYVSDADGSNERGILNLGVIASNCRPAWSPDGKKLAVGGRKTARPWELLLVDPEAGTSTTLGDHHWDFIGSVAWLPDGSGMIASGASETFRDQLWIISYPQGEVRPLTNDLNNYGDLSVTLSDDGNSLVAVQSKSTSNLWEYSLRSGQSRRLTTGTSMDGLGGVSVAPDGTIFFGTNSGKELAIFSLSPDGRERRQVTRNLLSVYPSVSRDGTRLAHFTDSSNGFVLRISNLDGSNAKTLALPFEPWLVQDPVSFSPDSKWIYLCTTQPGKMGIWKVPADGNGEPVLLRAGAYLAAAISPDGHFMKVGMYDEGTRQLSDVIISFDNSEGPKTLPIAPGKPLLVQWTPDGKGVSYIAEENGLSNIYYLPWPRGKYKRLTSFDNDTIFNYAWASPDRIILSRGTESSDIVLLTNLRHK